MREAAGPGVPRTPFLVLLRFLIPRCSLRHLRHLRHLCHLRRLRWVCPLCCLCCLCSLIFLCAFPGRRALAEDRFLRLDRVDGTGCPEGTVVVSMTEVSLDGRVFEARAEDYRLVVADRMGSRPPREAISTDGALMLGIVVETNLAMSASAESIRRGLLGLLGGLRPTTRGFLMTYHRAVTLAVRYGGLVELSSEVARLRFEGYAEADLVPALGRALDAFEALPAGRRALVVVSDGVDDQSDQEDSFRSLGDRARSLGVPIHPIAFSPVDERSPFLNLGEVAKRSFGTFRWAKTESDIEAESQRLSEELQSQRQLMFDVGPEACEERQEFRVARGTLRSNPRRLQKAESLAATQGVPRAVLGALLLLATLLVVGFGLWLRRRLRTSR